LLKIPAKRDKQVGGRALGSVAVDHAAFGCGRCDQLVSSIVAMPALGVRRPDVPSLELGTGQRDAAPGHAPS
jgi:hypothetical protein